MTSGLGRVVKAGRDLGAGFAVGSRMALIVKALQSRYRREAPDLVPAQASTNG